MANLLSPLHFPAYIKLLGDVGNIAKMFSKISNNMHPKVEVRYKFMKISLWLYTPEMYILHWQIERLRANLYLYEDTKILFICMEWNSPNVCTRMENRLFRLCYGFVLLSESEFIKCDLWTGSKFEYRSFVVEMKCLKAYQLHLPNHSNHIRVVYDALKKIHQNQDKNVLEKDSEKTFKSNMVTNFTGNRKRFYRFTVFINFRTKKS